MREGGRRREAAAVCPPSPSSSSFRNHLIQSLFFLLEIKRESNYLHVPQHVHQLNRGERE